MLAAAALVNVMQRIFDGSTPAGEPSSMSLMTRCASTWVLPEPALAETNTAADGSDASACRLRTESGMMRTAVIRGCSHFLPGDLPRNWMDKSNSLQRNVRVPNRVTHK